MAGLARELYEHAERSDTTVIPRDLLREAADRLVEAAGMFRAAYGATTKARVEAACAEIGREVAFRRVVYPRFVADGKLSQEKASRQVEVLEDAAALLRELVGMPRGAAS